MRQLSSNDRTMRLKGPDTLLIEDGNSKDKNNKFQKMNNFQISKSKRPGPKGLCIGIFVLRFFWSLELLCLELPKAEHLCLELPPEGLFVWNLKTEGRAALEPAGRLPAVQITYKQIASLNMP